MSYSEARQNSNAPGSLKHPTLQIKRRKTSALYKYRSTDLLAIKPYYSIHFLQFDFIIYLFVVVSISFYFANHPFQEQQGDPIYTYTQCFSA